MTLYTVLGTLLVPLATLPVALGLRALWRMPALPRMARFKHRALACGVMWLVLLAVVLGGFYGGALLRDHLLGGLHPNVHNSEKGMSALMVGVLCPAIVLGYLAAAGAYLACFGKTGDMAPKTEADVRPRKKSGKPLRYKALEGVVYSLFTLAFLVSACLYAWGLGH